MLGVGQPPLEGCSSRGSFAETGHEFTKCGEAVSGEGVGGGIGRGRWEIGGIRGEK